MEKIKFYAGGKWIESKTERYENVYNPSTGEILAQTPYCTVDEVNYAVQCAKEAYPKWSSTPVMKRAQILYRVRELIVQHMDELTDSVCRENGKAWGDAEGDVLKAKEATEIAISMPTLMMGESLMDTSTGIDTVLYREPLGVFVGIAPFNFPAMIPMGWMTPMCIAAGNTIVLKASNLTPLTSMKFVELYRQAGLPDGVINIVTADRVEAEALLTNPDVKGVSFVGTTRVGLEVYSKAAAHGKRVQAQCEAKNHALVLRDADIDKAAAGIINGAFGCAGERCMALPVVVVEESVADRLVAAIVQKAKALKVGPAYDKTTDMGPVVTAAHRNSILKWIETGLQEGATLALDGRQCVVPGYEKGFYLGATVLDHVKPGMSVGDREIFGPVLCIKRVQSFAEGLQIMNANPFANGSVIFTQSGYYAREFKKRTHGGMVGINVGIPVPVGMFPFSGHKHSFFGDAHCLGKDGVRFYTETKCVTERWFDEEDRQARKVDSWDGTI